MTPSCRVGRASSTRRLIIIAIGLLVTFLLVVKLLHGDTPPNQANQATVKPYTAKNGYATNVSSSALAEWPEWQRVLHRDFAFALLTTKKFHPRLEWAMKSWWKRSEDVLFDVLSDSSDSSFLDSEGHNVTIPNLHSTGCDSSYQRGLCCKNAWMLKHWKEEARFKNVKWFYRGMDDSWVHLPNLVHLAAKYDHTKPMIIGERVCTTVHAEYADGGPGFLISRGVIDHPDLLSSWDRGVREIVGYVLDDMVWGLYAKKNGISVVHEHGFSHASLSPKTEIYNYYLRQEGREWPLTFRPIAYHQGDDAIQYMPEVNKRMTEMDFGIPSKDPYTPPNCLCQETAHRRCGYSPELSKGKCFGATGELVCYGPGPWPNNVTSAVAASR